MTSALACRCDEDGNWTTPLGEACNERHCPLCRGNKGHDLAWGTYVCPVCINAIRTDMSDAETLVATMPAEAVEKGVNSEAAHQAGPNTDPTMWTWHRINARRSGQDAEEWDMLHAGTCFAHWERELREDFGHDDDVLSSPTLSQARGYLDMILSVMAQSEEHVLVLAELGTDMRKLRRHLEGVLRDGEQVDTGAPCLRCATLLHRVHGTDKSPDSWKCPRCHDTYTEQRYRLVVAHLHREEATWLNDQDMELRTGVKAATVRSWARKRFKVVDGERVEVPAPVASYREQGKRVTYSVTDVEREARRAGLLPGTQHAS